jgi:ferric-dicitrate binding protein FerR (iron transport regulator)
MKAEAYIEKYLNHTATAEERQVVETWFAQQQAGDNYPAYERSEVELAMWAKIEAAMGTQQQTQPARIFTLRRLARVAVLIGVVALAGLGYYQWSRQQQSQLARTDLKQLKNKAATNGGFIAMQQDKMVGVEQLPEDAALVIGNLSFRRVGDGIVINSTGTDFSDTSGISIVTPKGRFITLTLPDNTVVKLNVASELRVAQNYMQHRTLQLSGEAFFDVVHNEKSPFRVEVRNAVVEDIGTRFNIQAYEGQQSQVITTVLEGAARVISMNAAHSTVLDTRTITANKQASVLPNSSSVAVTDNTEEIKSAVAWEQGYFRFYNSDMKDILRTVGNWYNIKFEGTDSVNGVFSGGLSRAANLASLLEVLETTCDCKFEIIDSGNIRVVSAVSSN